MRNLKQQGKKTNMVTVFVVFIYGNIILLTKPSLW